MRAYVRLKGFSEGNMRKMRLFYEAWQPIFEKRSQVANEIKEQCA